MAVDYTNTVFKSKLSNERLCEMFQSGSDEAKQFTSYSDNELKSLSKLWALIILNKTSF